MSRLWILSFFVIAMLSVTPFAQAQKDGLILYLPLDDGGGNTATNTVGDNATVNGAQWVSTDRSGGLEFNGTDNSTEIPLDFSPQAPGNQGAMTICAWVKVIAVATDSHGQTRQPIVMKGNGSDGWEYGLLVYDDLGAGLSVWTCAGSGVSEPHAADTLPLGEWHHTCGTWTVADGVKVYVDGVEVTQGAADAAKEACDGSASIFLGHREDGQFLNAVIDEVAMWERALTVDEVKANMDGALSSSEVAVEPTGKLATTWANVRRSY
jgi:hypothetical protein